jgi:hypothetical protein
LDRLLIAHECRQLAIIQALRSAAQNGLANAPRKGYSPDGQDAERLEAKPE